MVSKEVATWFEENGYGTIKSTRGVGGGCINDGTCIHTSSGESFFLKTNRNCPEDMFACEYEGLEEMRIAEVPRVPKAFLYGKDFLLIEDLKPASRCSDYWIIFGRELAKMHENTKSKFGFNRNNYIGSTPQPNQWMEDGYRFFSQERLMFQADLANERGLLQSGYVGKTESLCKRLHDLVPMQPASLIHGDLWSGNAISDSDGKPAIIDPATHYGWAEAELAMTTLFGSFPDRFYSAYEEVRALESQYRSRFPIYNLYHLLNHLNLFGRGYLGQVQAILNRYS